MFRSNLLPVFQSYPEDGGGRLHVKLGTFLPDYTALRPRSTYLGSKCHRSFVLASQKRPSSFS